MSGLNMSMGLGAGAGTYAGPVFGTDGGAAVPASGGYADTGSGRAMTFGPTGATAGALALLGALLGTAGAYAALLAWHRSDLHPLVHIPVVNLIIILAGLPMAAGVGGWLLAGREPAMSRQPLE